MATNPETLIEKTAAMSFKTWGMLLLLAFVVMVVFFPLRAAAQMTGAKLAQTATRAVDKTTSAASQSNDPIAGLA